VRARRGGFAVARLPTATYNLHRRMTRRTRLLPVPFDCPLTRGDVRWIYVQWKPGEDGCVCVLAGARASDCANTLLLVLAQQTGFSCV